MLLSRRGRGLGCGQLPCSLPAGISRHVPSPAARPVPTTSPKTGPCLSHPSGRIKQNLPSSVLRSRLRSCHLPVSPAAWFPRWPTAGLCVGASPPSRTLGEPCRAGGIAAKSGSVGTLLPVLWGAVPQAAERGRAQPCLLFLPAGDGGTFGDRRGRGGCGVPPSLHPLPWSCSRPGVAGPDTGSGTGGCTVPGRRLVSRG